MRNAARVIRPWLGQDVWPELRSGEDGLPARAEQLSRLAVHEGDEVVGRQADYRASSRIRMPATIMAMPASSAGLVFSLKKRIEATKVKTSSIWPRART